MLYHLRDSRSYIRRILKSDGGEIFMRYFKGHLVRIFEGELEKIESPVPKDYLLHHMVSDFAETVRWWMDRGTYTPEEVAGFFLGTTPFSSAGPGK